MNFTVSSCILCSFYLKGNTFTMIKGNFHFLPYFLTWTIPHKEKRNEKKKREISESEQNNCSLLFFLPLEGVFKCIFREPSFRELTHQAIPLPMFWYRSWCSEQIRSVASQLGFRGSNWFINPFASPMWHPCHHRHSGIVIGPNLQDAGNCQV